MAVASEPEIIWRGEDAEQIIDKIKCNSYDLIWQSVEYSGKQKSTDKQD